MKKEIIEDMRQMLIPLEERTIRSADEILETQKVYAFRNSYQKKDRQLDLMKHRYEMLRADFENLRDRYKSLKYKIETIKEATRLKKTDEEMKGYGNYERRCLEEVDKIFMGT